MQLKGLVRFFTIVLILVSLYVLSFTWFVRNHEKKLEASAKSFVRTNYPDAKGEQFDSIYKARLTRLKDSTKDVVITYGINGAMTYQQAKKEELNLGLDLQGGMNVTLEVEMTGLLKTLANNSKDPSFLKALDNANNRKGNSDANFIRLFAEEYKKLNPTGNLASLFATGKSKITLKSSDSEVINTLEELALDAFDNTYRIMRTRIDQFGVAQPNINPDRTRGTITVELPGIQDKERVRTYLQSSANLQFWELYNIMEIAQSIEKADATFFALMGGKSATPDTTQQDTASKAPVDTAKTDGGLKTLDANNNTEAESDTANKTAATNEDDIKKHLYGYIGFIMQPVGKHEDGSDQFAAAIGYVPIKDTALVRSYLELPSVKAAFPSQLTWMYGIPERDKNNRPSDNVPLYAIKTFGRDKAKIEGDAVSDSRADFSQTGRSEVTMQMTSAGGREWAKMTTENHNKPIAIVLDNIVYSAPNVNEPITGGRSSISGSFTVEEAQDLARILNGGKYPAPAKIVQEQQVGPTLGTEAINGGMMAFGIAFIVIFALMLIYYNSSGWITNIALVLNLLFTVGVLTALGATLTAPGIAGLILTIGLAVDTNVITKERIKEELTKGKGYIPAHNIAFRRSLPPILDGHITILLTAVILFYFGLGPVKGFATTQILGIILSLFTGVLVTRWISDIFHKRKVHLQYFTNASRKIFQQAKFNFVGFRRKALIISFVILALGIASLFHGFDYGVEFNGGRSYTVRFDKNVSGEVEKIRDELKASLNGENPVIKTIGDAKTLDITTSYLIKEPGQGVDSLVESRIFEGLKNHLPANLTYQQFDQNYKLGSKKVLPTISDDLKRGAIQATVFAILIIFLYIFIRFRDWRYSIGTIIALLHDVLVTLIVFSFARLLHLPFSLEIDQHFIAAILTVIGFSMNEAVIIFDRIREDRKLYPTAALPDTINRAINETLSRTIMTSLTVFLTILVIFIVGGEATRGFAFAMLIGVITGVYSSMFVAAPMLLNLGTKKQREDASVLADKPSVKPETVKS